MVSGNRASTSIDHPIFPERLSNQISNNRPSWDTERPPIMNSNSSMVKPINSSSSATQAAPAPLSTAVPSQQSAAVLPALTLIKPKKSKIYASKIENLSSVVFRFSIAADECIVLSDEAQPLSEATVLGLLSVNQKTVLRRPAYRDTALSALREVTAGYTLMFVVHPPVCNNATDDQHTNNGNSNDSNSNNSASETYTIWSNGDIHKFDAASNLFQLYADFGGTSVAIITCKPPSFGLLDEVYRFSCEEGECYLTNVHTSDKTALSTQNSSGDVPPILNQHQLEMLLSSGSEYHNYFLKHEKLANRKAVVQWNEAGAFLVLSPKGKPFKLSKETIADSTSTTTSSVAPSIARDCRTNSHFQMFKSLFLLEYTELAGPYRVNYDVKVLYIFDRNDSQVYIQQSSLDVSTGSVVKSRSPNPVPPGLVTELQADVLRLPQFEGATFNFIEDGPSVLLTLVTERDEVVYITQYGEYWSGGVQEY